MYCVGVRVLCVLLCFAFWCGLVVCVFVHCLFCPFIFVSDCLVSLVRVPVCLSCCVVLVFVLFCVAL